MRYAQVRAGQKLHLVHTRDERPEMRALCGRRGPWRLTINLPMGMACKRCLRAARKEARDE